MNLKGESKTDPPWVSSTLTLRDFLALRTQYHSAKSTLNLSIYDGYLRYIEGRLREEFGFDGTPLRIHVRKHH